jgi:hypothetical protein
MRHIVAVVLALWSAACNLIGPSCVSRQERGTVATIDGMVGANELAVHRLAYDTRGSQNDATFLWPAVTMQDGARFHVYATRASCEDFVLPADNNTGECAILARAGWTPIGAARTVILTHGRGNPERLGSPPEYKLWVTSDRFTSYSFTVTYFFGPDC